MRLFYFPYFCGGRILCGLYTQTRTLEKGTMFKEIHSRVELGLVFYQSAEHQSSEKRIAVTNEIFVPNTLEEFQQILAYQCGYYTMNQGQGHQGLVIAITNTDQRKADEYLKASGFEIENQYDKHWGKGSGCKFWIGDYHGKLKPAFKNVPNPMEMYINAKPASKFSS